MTNSIDGRKIGHQFTIYHGHPSPNALEKCREVAPGVNYGAEWSPAKMTDHDWPYILDNGAFAAYKHGYPWDATAFVNRLREVTERMPREPDFVVLPDVVTNAEATTERATTWAEYLEDEFRTAFPIQDGHEIEKIAPLAADLNCTALFIGGTIEWKQRHGADIVEAAHEHDLHCHIGRPGDLCWVREIGADSVDTTSIVTDQNWDRLRQFSEQQTLEMKK
jgi:hypothetical protein